MRPGKGLGRRLRLRWFDRARSRAARGAASERQQRDISSALDGDTEPALMTSANSGHAARENLAALLHELRKNVGALVVEQIHFFDTEFADFLFAKKLPFAAARTAGSSAWTTGAAFTASTTTWSAFATSAATTMSTAAMTSTRAGTFAARGWN